MILEINFEKNLVTDILLTQKKIPCVCIVSDTFNIGFNDPLPKVTGLVHDWDLSILEERSPASAGGKCVYHQLGLITLSKIDTNTYKVIDLDFFCEDVGWCTILENGEHGPEGGFWDDDDF